MEKQTKLNNGLVQDCIESFYEDRVRLFLECENGDVLNEFENYVLCMREKLQKSNKKTDHHQYGENGYPLCHDCDEEIMWGQPCVYWTFDFFHPKCWDKFCEEYYK